MWHGKANGSTLIAGLDVKRKYEGSRVFGVEVSTIKDFEPKDISTFILHQANSTNKQANNPPKPPKTSPKFFQLKPQV